MKEIPLSEDDDLAVIFEEINAHRMRGYPGLSYLLGAFTYCFPNTTSSGKSLYLLYPRARTNLANWLNHGTSEPVSDDVIYDSCMYLMSSLAFMHCEDPKGMSLIHYDLKPENILMPENGFGFPWVIADFGQTKVFSALNPNKTTVHGQKDFGSYVYRPPEYYNMDKSRGNITNGKTFDIWAAGCILLEVAIYMHSNQDKDVVSRFKKDRGNNPDEMRRIPNLKSPDFSFHNNMAVVRKKLDILQNSEFSLFQKLGRIISPMLEMDPARRPTALEIKLRLDREIGQSDLSPRLDDLARRLGYI